MLLQREEWLKGGASFYGGRGKFELHPLARKIRSTAEKLKTEAEVAS